MTRCTRVRFTGS